MLSTVEESNSAWVADMVVVGISHPKPSCKHGSTSKKYDMCCRSVSNLVDDEKMKHVTIMQRHKQKKSTERRMPFPFRFCICRGFPPLGCEMYVFFCQANGFTFTFLAVRVVSLSNFILQILIVLGISKRWASLAMPVKTSLGEEGDFG